MATKEQEKQPEKQTGGLAFEEGFTASNKGAELSLKQVQSETMKALRQSQKIRMVFPSIPGEKKQRPLDLQLNGVTFRCQRGIAIDVPEPLVQVYNNSLSQEQKTAEYVQRIQSRAQRVGD